MIKHLISIKSLFPNQKFGVNNIEHNPLFDAERDILVLGSTHSSAQLVYTRLHTDLAAYGLKIPNSLAKTCVDYLITRKLIFLGVTKSGHKSGVLGTILLNKNKLAGIVLESGELNIDTRTGESSAIDRSFYASYFEYIRATCILNETKIIKDSNIHHIVCKYLSLIFLKAIGSGVNFTEKQKIFLEVLVNYFYLRFMLRQNHNKIKEIITGPLSKELQSEIVFLLPRLEKYKTMKDIFKAFIDFNISHEPPTAIIMKLLNKYKIFTFSCFVGSLDYLISLIITSLYPVDFLEGALINKDLQGQLESHLSKYLTTINFDTSAVQ